MNESVLIAVEHLGLSLLAARQVLAKTATEARNELGQVRALDFSERSITWLLLLLLLLPLLSLIA